MNTEIQENDNNNLDPFNDPMLVPKHLQKTDMEASIG